MLLRLDAVLFRGRFAEVKKAADLTAKLRQIAVLRGNKIAHNLYRITIQFVKCVKRS